MAKVTIKIFDKAKGDAGAKVKFDPPSDKKVTPSQAQTIGLAILNALADFGGNLKINGESASS